MTGIPTGHADLVGVPDEAVHGGVCVTARLVLAAVRVEVDVAHALKSAVTWDTPQEQHLYAALASPSCVCFKF